MKVVNENGKSTVKFEDLDEGQCFKWAGSLLIKTDCEQDAVDLADGTIYSDMCGEDEIIPINAEVHITD